MGFDKAGIRYEVVEADEVTAEKLREEGFGSFPVVKVDLGGGDATWSWSGYRHDDIRKLAQLYGG